MIPICARCQLSKAGDWLCLLSGHHYGCEHPDWMRQPYPMNYVRECGQNLYEDLPNNLALPAAIRLKPLLGLQVHEILSVSSAAPWAKARYRNAAWMATAKQGASILHVYSMIDLRECLAYPKWEHTQSSQNNDAGHIAVWPKYPYQGHQK